MNGPYHWYTRALDDEPTEQALKQIATRRGALLATLGLSAGTLLVGYFAYQTGASAFGSVTGAIHSEGDLSTARHSAAAAPETIISAGSLITTGELAGLGCIALRRKNEIPLVPEDLSSDA